MPLFKAPAQIDSHFGVVVADADAATVTFDMDRGDKHALTLGGNRTLAVTGDNDGQVFMVILKQDATGSRVPVWWGGILWPDGTVPTLTTTAGKYDVFSFLRLSAGVYLGFTVGLNL
jgi:hypothetical protein